MYQYTAGGGVCPARGGREAACGARHSARAQRVAPCPRHGPAGVCSVRGGWWAHARCAVVGGDFVLLFPRVVEGVGLGVGSGGLAVVNGCSPGGM